MLEVTEHFKQAIRSAGLNPPEIILADGQKHRFSTNNKPNDRAGEYCLYPDDVPAGYFHDWRTGIYQPWCSTLKTRTFQERLKCREKITMIRIMKEKEQMMASEKANKIWEMANLASSDHPYLIRKRVKPHKIRQYNGSLIIPLYLDEKLFSLQFITANGDKFFLENGRVRGCCFSIERSNKTFGIVEGYATAASILESTEYSMIVAFNAGNLLPVSLHLRNKYPKAKIIIFADDDRYTKGNPGLTKAREAAIASGSMFTSPKWPPGAPDTLSDFNDLACWIKDQKEQAT